jgi:serine/threonine-protein kinase
VNTIYDRVEAQNDFNGLRSLDHPLIPQVADIIKDPEDCICIIMHKCKCNLEEMLLKKGQISEEEILKIIAMFCLPLDNIHQKGVVHRDFKPQNILVSSIGSYDILLLTDFGVSKQKSLTFSTTVNDKMTTEYASLEQIRK